MILVVTSPPSAENINRVGEMSARLCEPNISFFCVGVMVNEARENARALYQTICRQGEEVPKF